jgi:2-polyprenyl-6-methoxyphenol hydroxylase-like FAD-dependent oxidoreductase
MANNPAGQREIRMPHRRAQKRALVIGGSMSGLLAALMLRRNGWRVDVFERAEDGLAGRGAGIVAQPEMIARLADLGLDTRDIGIPITARKVFDGEGRLVASGVRSQVVTAWERVYHILRGALPDAHYHPGRTFKSVQQDDSGVIARFSDGGTERAELLIGADGLRSTVRQQFLPAIAPLYAGYVAWRALVAESSLAPPTHRDLFDALSFCLPPGEQILGYPVAGPGDDLRPARRRYNIVWYRPADPGRELIWLLTDESGTVHSISIPPPLIRREAAAAMRVAAERLLAPQFREIVRLVQEPLLQPIYDLESPQLSFGRAAIIGDAAFVARPHVAAGLSKAADDAAALAAALEVEDVAGALRRFEAERLPEGRKIIERARHLGAYLQETQSAEEQKRSARHSIPEAVLAETAILDFLHR